MLKRLLALSVILFAACTPKVPPKPPQPPQPPVVEGTPARGVPVAPEMLLRPGPNATVTLKGQQWHAFMAVPCCNTFSIGGVEKNSRWPMASEEWMDYTSRFGANAWHFRMGPFVAGEIETEWRDRGGTYMPGTVEPDERHRQKKRDLVYHALKLGGIAEVAVVDLWGCKADQQGIVGPGAAYTGLPMSEVEACGRRPSPEIEKHIRRQVEDLGCFGNVIWSLDVEGGNIQGTRPEWYLWAKSVIRDEEQRSGCGFVHMIGTNSGLPEVVSQVDYVQTHEREKVQAIAGRWTLQNEHNPELASPAHEVDYFRDARSKGLAWAAWRAGMDEPTYEAVLRGFQAVIRGETTDCVAPDAEDPRWKPGPIRTQCKTASVLEEAKAEVGDRRGLFPAGPPDAQFAAMFQTLDLLSAAMRRRGVCASRSRDSVFAKAQDGIWEELHAVAATDGGYTGNACKGSTWIYQ
jgi:hypothetical protein